MCIHLRVSGRPRRCIVGVPSNVADPPPPSHTRLLGLVGFSYHFREARAAGMQRDEEVAAFAAAESPRRLEELMHGLTPSAFTFEDPTASYTVGPPSTYASTSAPTHGAQVALGGDRSPLKASGTFNQRGWHGRAGAVTPQLQIPDVSSKVTSITEGMLSEIAAASTSEIDAVKQVCEPLFLRNV